MKREQWKSRLGFIWAAVGSAVGLGSIWRFPYVVGENGGAAFVFIYLICLALVGFPILIAEIVIGRKTQKNPSTAFSNLGKSRIWKAFGKMTIVTGFLVSSFYGVIAGWTLGYLYEAIFGRLTHFATSGEAVAHFQNSVTSPRWACATFFSFMLLCIVILFFGVRKGIERANKIFMPLLMIVLVALALKGLSMKGGYEGLLFLFKPDFAGVTPQVVLMALGQAFFALSLGQGTMVTYGSYLSKEENIPTTCFPIALFGVFVSLFAGIAIFTIVFSAGLEPTSGEGLMFQTLPYIFSQMKGGAFFALLFFLLIFLAGITSQISALEPMIAYFVDEKKWGRHKATLFTVGASFLVGIPSALSFGPLKKAQLFERTFFDWVSQLSVNILIPLGGLAAALLVGWRWGIQKSEEHLLLGTETFFLRHSWFKRYLSLSIKYIAPLIILIILVDQLF